MSHNGSTSSNNKNSIYNGLRASVDDASNESSLSRVEVNQRALIDKILARYASAGAVYRELLQNSNDAEATQSEIYFVTTMNESNIVQEVTYRNNGMPFRPQDWDRLRKIAEGNPNPSKVGAFGVGAYTMFSICEEPIVMSGSQALAFIWKGDALWTKTTTLPKNQQTQWTSFVLPSRDAYPLPDLVEFGEFLAASLTFTKCLKHVQVFVNGKERLSILKTLVEAPRLVKAPQLKDNNNNSSNSNNSSMFWWATPSLTSSSSSLVKTASPKGTFYLDNTTKTGASSAAFPIYETIYRIFVALDDDMAYIDARYVSAVCKTKIPPEMAKRMERVTKKQPPKEVTLEIFLNAAQQQHDEDDENENKKKIKKSPARRITQSFVPQQGAGRIFIGFRTSQTTGLAAHVAAPFCPTVEREAMDLQDAALCVYNTELLHMAGILLRLTLHHAFSMLHVDWINNAPQRAAQLKHEVEAEELKKRNKGGGKLVGGQAATSSSTTTTTKGTSGETGDDDDENDDDDATTSGGGSSLMGFARFMARGVKKKIVSVVSSVEQFLEDGGTGDFELLHPMDLPRSLATEERHAILLMQSYCPRQSTPDAAVGTALAQGFSNCMPSSSSSGNNNTPSMAPPVLTKSGVLAGDDARLPNHGMEAFVQDKVIRSVVYENAKEYHDVIARTRKLTVRDLGMYLENTVITQEQAIRLVQWWRSYSRVIDGYMAERQGVAIKELVRFYPDNAQDATTTSTTLAKTKPATKQQQQQQKPFIVLKDLLFYIPKDSLLYKKQQELPLPETVLPLYLQLAIGLPTLADNALLHWFSPLPMELWAEFVSHAPCMVEARPEDEDMRIQVWAVLHKEFQSRSYDDRQVFASFCQSLFAQKRCLPFDSQEPVSFAADRPSDLYLYSAELKAFEGASSTTSFRKVATSLKQAGVGEDFLLCLGVRKSVAVDFLFAHLDTLKWSNDPRPLIEYLRTATLTREDLHKLSQTKYLPAEKDDGKASYAPSEVYLPTVDLRIFPFLKILLWPSENEVSENSENGRFLVRLGVQRLPSLQRVLEYVANEIRVADKKQPEDAATQAHRRQCLDFLAERLGPKGVYHQEYTRMRDSIKNNYRILPCVTQIPLAMENSDSRQSQLMSPVMCYSEESCGIMGFPVIDHSKLGDSGKLYGSLFQCEKEPNPTALLNQLKYLVSRAQAQQRNVASSSPEAVTVLAKSIESTFSAIFKYLSSSDFTRSELQSLAGESFIPCRLKDTVNLAWFKPSQVFFRQETSADNLTEELFQVIDFSPFLAAAGVKQEATTRELFQLLLHSPNNVLQALGSEKKYRALLRRIAANRPFDRVTEEIKKAPFLLAYTIKTNEANDDTTPTIDSTTYDLAAAEDIFIIDNSFFGRMFPVKRAPHESDLEDFYAFIGSHYISKSVERRFEVVGRPIKGTELTHQLQERIVQRAPLLVSPHVTTRPLVPNAASILDKKHLDFFQATNLMAVFSLGGVSRRNRTTCFSRKIRGQNVIYVVEDFDWFDVGYAIGDLILQRCQLEDAFFISSLLDAPLEQLRARGFPVERILLPKPAPEPPPPPAPPVAPTPQPTPATAHSIGTGTIAKIPEASIAAAAAGTRAKIPDAPTSTTETTDAQKPASSINRDTKPPVSTNDQEASSTSPPPTDSKTSASAKDSGFTDIIQQMFPDADADFICGALGPNPDLEAVRRLAESMATGNYPKSDTASDAGTLATAESSNTAAVTSQPSSPTDSAQRKAKSGLRKKLGRAFGGLKGSSFGGAHKPPIEIPKGPMGGGTMPAGFGMGRGGNGTGGGLGAAGPSSNIRHETQGPVTPGTDEQSQTNLERMLERAVGSSSTIDGRGVQSQDQVVTSVPADLDRGDTCEVVDGQSLKPFPGARGDGKTSNGIRIFSSRKDASSETFLAQNTHVVESFALVLQRLSIVFGHKLASMAIYYDPSGRTIAFNSGGGALHFNLRFFYALHFLTNKSNSRECYSYWYMTMSHELAHNLVSAHSKEHGFYTESFASHFLPKLIELLQNL